MDLRFCCSEHKADPLQSLCTLYDHIIVSPELRYCGPAQSGQYSKVLVSCQVVTTYLCIVWIQSELELRFCCTEIAVLPASIWYQNLIFAKNGVLRYCGAEPSTYSLLGINLVISYWQWRKPDTSPGNREARKKGKWKRKGGKLKKGRWKICKWKEEKFQNE